MADAFISQETPGTRGDEEIKASLKTHSLAVDLSLLWGSSEKLRWNFFVVQGRHPTIAFL